MSLLGGVVSGVVGWLLTRIFGYSAEREHGKKEVAYETLEKEKETAEEAAERHRTIDRNSARTARDWLLRTRRKHNRRR